MYSTELLSMALSQRSVSPKEEITCLCFRFPASHSEILVYWLETFSLFYERFHLLLSKWHKITHNLEISHNFEITPNFRLDLARTLNLKIWLCLMWTSTRGTRYIWQKIGKSWIGWQVYPVMGYFSGVKNTLVCSNSAHTHIVTGTGERSSAREQIH